VTLGCCECHDHKYDPFKTRDFYRFEAFFADIQEKGLYSGAHESGDWGPRVQLPSPQQAQERARLVESIAGVKRDLESAGDAKAALDKQLKQLDKELAELDQRIPSTLVTASVPPRMVRVLPRGNWMDESGEIVAPGFPDFLPQPAAAQQRLTRLDLAHWVVAPENPLTARALVNRIWKRFFGTGLSRKVDDLGAQGDWPTHPELLDFLADDFMTHGWDLKRLVRMIVMSDTYRQSSRNRGELSDIDPSNTWLARQNRFRLDAEAVRDNALAVSGLLIRQVGGPSVKPYQPPGYWAYLNFPQREWQNGSGAELYRRGIYTHWQRQYLHPSLLAFDAPTREECVADRARSNTPIQSLVLLNDPVYVEAAKAFALGVLREGGTATDDRLNWAFGRALSRSATAEEATVLKNLVAGHVEYFTANAQAADELLATGATAVPTDLNRADLAAWTSACRVILNLHETITRN
jgi:hypothetical protein